MGLRAKYSGENFEGVSAKTAFELKEKKYSFVDKSLIK